MTDAPVTAATSETGWTGGQYSIFRILLGTWLLVLFARLLPHSAQLALAELPEEILANPVLGRFPNVLVWVHAPGFSTAMLALGLVLAMVLVVGWHDRWAALALWYLWACVYTLAPQLAGDALPAMGWLLLAHACLPTAPYGSWAAVGRVDPRGDWQMLPAAWYSAWVLLAVGYTAAGAEWALSGAGYEPRLKVLWNAAAVGDLSPGVLSAIRWSLAAFGLSFAPLAFSAKLRPWVWCAGVALQIVGILCGLDIGLRTALLLLHLFVFDPAWVRPRPADVTEQLFYDGHCGLCHRVVRLVLSEDRTRAFRLAPLESETFQTAVPDEVRKKLPDSTVVRTVDGRLLTQSEAALYVLGRLGGMWRVMGALASVVPLGILDVFYVGIARIRRRLFDAPTAACPILPPDLRARFDH